MSIARSDGSASFTRSPAAAHIQQSLRHTRIMASAGSGKTFKLANRYLSLLRAGADPESILASTFTRLAAGEIRDRVLTALAELAEDENERTKLAEHIGGPIDREEAIDILIALTKRLHKLQVRTLDSFFSAIVRAFALELGIDPAAEIVDEPIIEGLRQEAILAMLDEGNERESERLLATLSALVDDLAERSVTDTIDDVVRSLYDLYLEVERDGSSAWEAVEPIPGLLDESGHKAAIRAFEMMAEAAPARADIKGEFFADKRVLSAVLADLDAVRASNLGSVSAWRGFIGAGVASKIVAGESVYYRREIPDDVRSAYMPFITHARALMRKIVIDRTLATRDLIASYHTHFESLKRRDKAMSFSDLTHALAGATSRFSDARALDEVYFRLDATLRHLLLDEMQDTSIAQWRALQPIVENVAANSPPDYSFFAVGDVKQSIYGWRGAVPEILETLPIELFGPDGEQTMDTPTLEESHRSSKFIIDAVNKLFGSIASNPVLSDHQSAADGWQATFKEHKTAKKLPGHVVLRTVRKAGEKEAKDDVRLREASELVADLYRQSEGANITIGVLTRTNKAASHLLHELREMNVPASVRGGGSLTDAPSVNVILDLFRLADHPGHTIAAFNVMHSPLGSALGLTDQNDRRRNHYQCERISRLVRRQVLDRGYAPLIVEWTALIAEHVDARERRRLILLQEQAVRFDHQAGRASGRCDDFVNHIESIDVADPFASPVQVMTVHQSKGLQFDAVVLPDLDGPLFRPQGRNVLIERDGAAGRITRIARHISSDVTELFDDLASMLAHHEYEQTREALSLLYVAMTRAKQALHMLTNPPKVNKNGSYAKSTSFAAVLHAGLGLAQCDPEPEAVLYERGEAAWMKRLNVKASERQSDGEDEVADDDPLDVSADRIEFGRASGDVARGRWQAGASALHGEDDGDDQSITLIERPLRDRLILPNQLARDRGNAIHAMFESLSWIEDGLPDEPTLTVMARRIAPRRGVEWAGRQARDFLAMFDHDAVCRALARPVGNGDDAPRLYREFPFARLIDGAIQRGYIDRLVIQYKHGTPIKANVLDFKTDDIDPAQAAERAVHYRRQMQVYRDTVRDVFSLDDDAITMELLFVIPGQLVSA